MALNMFNGHYHERLDRTVKDIYSREDHNANRIMLDLKLREKGMFLSENEPIRVSYLPRVLPQDYKPVIEQASRLVTESLFETAYSDGYALALPGLNSTLISHFGVLDTLPKKIVGTARYDFTVSGKPTLSNPPRLLEVNMLDYGGNGWVQEVNESLLEIMPELREVVTHIPIIDEMADNFKRLGKKILFVCEEDLSYTDFIKFRDGILKRGVDIHMILDSDLFNKIRKCEASFSRNGIYLNGHDKFDFIYLRSLSTPKEIMDSRDIIYNLLDNNVPMYDSLFGLILENKSALPIFHNAARKLKSCDKDLADKVFIGSHNLDENLKKELIKNPENYVLKYSDDHFGRSVYVGGEMLPILKNLGDYAGWCVQDFVKLNKINVWPLDADKPISGIVDLAVYVNYVWNSEMPPGQRLEFFSLSGQLCRTSTSNYKVNVSSGGCFVPIFFSKG